MRTRTRTGRGRAVLGTLAGLTATIGLTTALAAPAHAAPAQADAGAPVAVTEYSHTSEAGDYIGQGGTAAYTPDTAEIAVTGDAGQLRLRVWAESAEDLTWWEVSLAAPKGERLRPGVYRDVERTPLRTGRAPGLDVYGEGRSCDDVYGRFAVNQIETDDSGAVTVLDATYTQRCDRATAPALKGVVKYRAFPLSYTYTSDPDDFVARGASGDHTGATSVFGLRPWAGGRGLQYNVEGNRESYSALMTPPTGEQFEAGRTYPVGGTDTEGVAGFGVSGNGRACATTTGTLTILKLVRDDAGTVTAFAARFEQHCGTSDAGLRGTIRYYA
ncbi:hypothetical protein AB0E75_17995 [Streptomyces griseoviridis]|uniref:Uncharacterized protein n=1 Tax=Streptomyces griseoviridis TaxID=45398 RepID=A0A918GQW5_STRGD|nr:hypothetical protein [Streptomyces niveoruber]GGS54232.1 hypothetical protein GCM10010238_49500 [Streptomyces niveoruber]